MNSNSTLPKNKKREPLSFKGHLFPFLIQKIHHCHQGYCGNGILAVSLKEDDIGA